MIDADDLDADFASLTDLPAFQAVASLANDDPETASALLFSIDTRDVFAACAMWAKLIECAAAGEPRPPGHTLESGNFWTFEIFPTDPDTPVDLEAEEPGLVAAMQLVTAFSNDDPEGAFAIFLANGGGGDALLVDHFSNMVAQTLRLAAAALLSLIEQATAPHTDHVPATTEEGTT